VGTAQQERDSARAALHQRQKKQKNNKRTTKEEQNKNKRRTKGCVLWSGAGGRAVHIVATPAAVMIENMT
jgi:hypothetical protein